MRRRLIHPALGFALLPAAIAQEHVGSGAEQLGSAVAAVGDVDGDGHDDLGLGAPDHDSGRGRVEVRSGRTGGRLHAVTGDGRGDRCGAALCGAGDVDGDGHADFAVGSPAHDPWPYTDAGQVRLYSGRTGSILVTIVGTRSTAAFGTALANLGDVDGDGSADLAIGSPGDDHDGTDRGRVAVHSGRDGRLLYELRGARSRAWFGQALGPVGDLDGDGVLELGVGAPNPLSATKLGEVLVHSGATGGLMRSITSDVAEDRFGAAVTGIDDVDGDGIAEIAIGSPRRSTDNGTRSGRVTIVSGRTFATIAEIDGAGPVEAFGSSLAPAGDFDGNGRGDVLVGAPQHFVGGRTAGQLAVISGHDGSVLLARDGTGDEMLGTSVACAGDTNADGTLDWIAGAPFAANRDGRALLVENPARAGASVRRRFGPTCAGSDGRLPRVHVPASPRIGADLVVTLRSAPRHAATMLVADVVPMRFSWTPLGAPGCVSLVAPTITLPTASSDAEGGCRAPAIPVPDAAELIGARLYFQWFAIDRGANALGAVASDGIKVLVGR